MKRFMPNLMLCLFIVLAAALFVPSAAAGSAVSATSTQRSLPVQWEKALAAAKAEGKVLVYSANGPQVRKSLADLVKEKFNITMDFVAASPGEIYQKYLTEHRAGVHNGDMIMSGGSSLPGLNKEGVLLPIEDKLIMPNAANPKAWPDGHPKYLGNPPAGVALTGAYWSYILVNTDMVKENDLKSYQGLADPKWKGKLAMERPVGSGAGVNWVMFIYRVIMGPEKADKFLTQLAKQEPLISSDTRQMTEWVARGKYPIAIAPSSNDVVAGFRKAGAPIAWRRMSEGGLVHPAASVVALFKEAPHPSAALVVYNWLLSDEGQAFYSKVYGQAPVRPGVPTQGLGLDPFTIPIPGEKVYLWNEEFGRLVNEQGSNIGKKYFGALIK